MSQPVCRLYTYSPNHIVQELFSCITAHVDTVICNGSSFKSITSLISMYILLIFRCMIRGHQICSHQINNTKTKVISAAQEKVSELPTPYVALNYQPCLEIIKRAIRINSYSKNLKKSNIELTRETIPGCHQSRGNNFIAAYIISSDITCNYLIVFLFHLLLFMRVS